MTESKSNTSSVSWWLVVLGSVVLIVGLAGMLL